MNIKINTYKGSIVLPYCLEDEGTVGNTYISLREHESYLSGKGDENLGLKDGGTFLWKSKTIYSEKELLHTLNHFMIRLLEGYLQTGEY